jgi:hypothetical protein
MERHAQHRHIAGGGWLRGGLGFLVLLPLVLLVHVSRAEYREEEPGTAPGNRKVEHRG